MYPKIPVIINKDYLVTLEPHANVLWVHCDVYKLSLSSMKNMKSAWEQFTSQLDSDLYVLYNSATNVPSKRYIEAFGFKYLKDVPNKEPYQIWKRGK